MTVEFTDDDVRDLQTMIMFALRYAQGRKTYAFSVVSSFIIGHDDIMQKWQLKQMADEIEQGITMWDLQDWEENEYREVAERLRELAEDDGTRMSVRTRRNE